ncbi:MAG: hypothetical protein ACI8X5_000529 [Planctomycetota bacterium]|jgi:hypothetical protein
MSTRKPDTLGKGETGASRKATGVTGGRQLFFGLLLFVLALGLRGRAVEHGLPRNYVPDTHVVRSALGMAKEKSLAPPVGQYSSYPNLLPYALLPIYATQFMSGRISGRWDSTDGYKNFVLEKPGEVHLLARWLMVFIGALSALAAFKAARAAGLREGAWAAAWFVATGMMHLHFSVQERPWVAVVFFMVLAAWPAANYVRKPEGRQLLLSGLLAALAGACHQSGLFALGIPGLAWLVSPLGFVGDDLVKRLKQGTLCVAAFGLLVLLVGYPAYLLHGVPSAAQTIGGDQADLSLGGQSINFARRWETFPHLARAFFLYDPVLTLFGLFGIVSLLKRRAALPAGLFALAWAAFFMTHSNEHVRYLLPLGAFLAFAAGSFVESVWQRGTAVRVAIVALSLLPMIQALRLGSLLERDDTRVEGELALLDLPSDSFVAIDRYGPIVDLDQSSLELLNELRTASGSSLYQREARRLEALRAGVIEGGVHGVYVSDLFEIDEQGASVTIRKGLGERLGEGTAEAFKRLGVTHFLLVNRLQTGIEGSLFEGFGKQRQALITIGPYAVGSEGGEARLPMELDSPATSIWAMERPGPWMGLFELKE